MNQSLGFFSIKISLTDKGERDYYRVIELIYMYINKIREIGPLEYIYDEIKDKRKIDFEV